MAAKTDWEYHKENYAKNYAEQGVSVAAYARENGLNPNTARVRMKGASSKENDRSIDKSTQKRSKSTTDRKKPTPKPKKNKEAKRAEKPTSFTVDGEKDKRIDRSSWLTSPLHFALKDSDSINQSRNGGRFTTKHLHNLSHGGGVDIKSLMTEICQETASKFELNPSYNIFQEECRLTLMTTLVDAAMSHRANLFDDDNDPPTKGESEQPMVLVDELANVVFGAATPIGMAADSIAKNKLKLLKLMQDDDFTTTKLDQAQVKTDLMLKQFERETGDQDKISELLASRTEGDMSAIDTAYLFVKAGIEPPTVLMEELKRELANKAPEVDNSVGITEDQLEEEARRRTIKRGNRVKWKEDRESILDSIYQEESQHKVDGLLAESDFDDIDADDLIDPEEISTSNGDGF